MTDQKLIDQFLQGDINAFNQLIRRWEVPIFNFTYKTVGNLETAKDICQITFIRVFKKLKHLKDKEKFASWIYQIAFNLCRDEFKKRKNRKVYSLDDSTDENPGLFYKLTDETMDNPDDICHNSLVGEIIKQAMQTLPDEQRVVIIMKQYQGLKFTEIADIIKEPVNTVKSRMYYGLRALKKTLESSEYSKEVLFDEM